MNGIVSLPLMYEILEKMSTTRKDQVSLWTHPKSERGLMRGKSATGEARLNQNKTSLANRREHESLRASRIGRLDPIVNGA
jgi:hypothetical protein